jgi:hypothetical protein
MSYTINLTDGQIFATIPDGTINTSSSMTLVGKNYAGYGQFLDDNFIRLLENGSNTTPPGAPLTGQLWWDKTNNLLKVYNGTVFKTISAATSSSTAPTSNTQGDLWYDTTNQLLKVWTGTQWLTVGPSVVSGTGAQAATITDNLNNTHNVIEFFVNNTLIAILSQDSAFTPAVGITGFSQVKPGFQLSSASASYLFQGTALSANQLNGLTSSQFMRSDANTSTSGTLAVLNNTGLSVGANQDLRVSVAGINATISNQTSNGNIAFGVNIGGTPTTVMTINGATGAISGNQITANYADVAERFAADSIYEFGTVVELGGSAEITLSQEDLSESVFGVISTKAAYLMNSGAGDDLTHPPVAMTGRVPVRTIGMVRKGDRLVSAGNGLARAAKAGEATAFNVIGRALVSKDTVNEGLVEAIVTIK